MKRRKRFTIVVGLAAAGVMALGAQTASAATYNTKLTISQERAPTFFGHMTSVAGKKCKVGRLVTMFKIRPGVDRKLGATRTGSGGFWIMPVPKAWSESGWRVYVKTPPKVGDGFVCNGTRSEIHTVL
jgi:hypothetical protein